MKQLLLSISYDGTAFAGWQIQPVDRTVQGAIEKALQKTIGEKVRILGSSRTDAGVHARDQKATFFTNSPIPAERMPLALKKNLPSDITITNCLEVPIDLHPIYHVRRKRYIYWIYNGSFPDFNLKRYVWHIPKPLDMVAMRAALPYLCGQHDFATFCAAGSQVRSTIRTIYEVMLTPRSEHLIELRFEGDGFLYKMIRIIVATLVSIGMGQRRPAEMAQIILSCNRREAPKTAPPNGLVLDQIWFDQRFRV